MLREVAHNVRSRAQVRIKPREDVQKDTAEGFRELSRRPLERSGRVLKAFVSAIEHWSATRDDFFCEIWANFSKFWRNSGDFGRQSGTLLEVKVERSASKIDLGASVSYLQSSYCKNYLLERNLVDFGSHFDTLETLKKELSPA